LNADLGYSVFIGDSDTNVQVALAVRFKVVLFVPGLSGSSRTSGKPKDLPPAHAATEPFRAVVKCLQTIEHGVQDDRPTRSLKSQKG
jgi:hypothetical protein